jgi:quercetin dioxygenase-like cupin family protein
MTARLALLRPMLAALTLAFGVPAAGHATELDPAAVAFRTPDQFKWRDPTDKADTNQTVLHGDPTKPGLYVNINKAKAGRFGVPHYHPNDRFITVLSGTWWKGSGTAVDPDNAVRLPTGSFVTDFGKQVHWDGTKDEAVTILIVGDGPATNIEVPKTTGKLAALDPMAVGYTLPEQYKWRDPTNASSTNQVILQGDPSKPGIYVNINRFKPGAFSRPHVHPNDRFIMVLKGTWWVGTGTKFDPNSTVPMRAGTFVTHFGKQVHFDGAKDEEVTVLIAGEGPATSTPAEEK